MLVVSVPARALLRTLLLVVSALVLAGYATGLLVKGFHVDARVARTAAWAVDLNTENNLPAWFSGTLLAVVALVVADVARRRRRERAPWAPHWALLAAAFTYLSLDEVVGLHERLNEPVSAVLGDGGALRYGWFAVALPLAAAFALLLARFLLALPRRTAGLVVLAGALYVGGAVGLEVLGNVLMSAGAPQDGVLLLTAYSVEELLEMSGAAVFLYAVVDHDQRARPEDEPGTARRGGLLAAGR
ncbi:hypothetical protein [Kineococcus indalonis]|uniref:hypothetical protein n=1 Tax=Kineococcus indalonis TaxID=2696566 RepID=UPI00141302E9|nr:hypothetical protein [Kineococcus indalonis]NAZ86202.1 hypothetical protein [Kineococcus indalonis]